MMQNERDVMARLRHRHIAQVEYSFESRFYVCLVMEYCAGGDMFNHLRRVRRMSEQDARYYFV